MSLVVFVILVLFTSSLEFYGLLINIFSCHCLHLFYHAMCPIPAVLFPFGGKQFIFCLMFYFDGGWY